MAIFTRDAARNAWIPGELASGPFGGLQGGAIAGLLAAEIEQQAAAEGLGAAVSATAWYFRPTPLAPLRTQVTFTHRGGRVSVVDNTLYPLGQDEPCATIRITLLRDKPIAVTLPPQPPAAPLPDPATLPLRQPGSPLGRPWFMDAMEARKDPDGTAWFALREAIVEGAGPLATVLGPADWAHGIARPVQRVVADPNPNLTVQLLRVPRGRWIGVRAAAQWLPERGAGMGHATLLDAEGEIGHVSMSVALTAFPKPPGSS